jgi:hypothetical protein
MKGGGKDAEARARVDRLRAVNPAAADLATLCSPAMRAEPTLVRRLRRLLPGADVAAESDLWASDLLSGATVSGIAIAPEVAALLRADLRTSRWDGVRAAALDAVAAEHAREHWSQRLEEQLHRMEVVGAPEQHREDLLLAALRELVEAGERVPASGRRRGRVGRRRSPDGLRALTPQQAGIARWLLGALARLPRADAESEAGRVVRLSADLHLHGHAPDTDTSDVVSAGWMPWLLDQATGRPVPVPVGFAAGVLDVGGRGPVVEVPRTDPLVLDVDWHDGRQARHRRLRFTKSDRLTVDVGTDLVELSALDGSGVTLRTARRPHAGLDFSAERARRRPCLAREYEIASALRAPDGVVYILGGRGTGKSVLACAVADRVERAGGVVAQHFFGVKPQWDTTEAVVASLVAQLNTGTPSVTASTDGSARLGAALTDAVRRSSAAAAHPVVVLLDALPPPPDRSLDPVYGPFERTVTEILVRSVPRGVRVVTTVDDDRWTGVELTEVLDLDGRGDPVCTAMLDRSVDGLRAAFGTNLDADPAPGVPHRDVLVALADANPGRLSAIVCWLLDCPAGTARLDAVPWLLTTREREIWGRLEDVTGSPRRVVDPAAVALPGYTVDDARRLVDADGDDAVRDTLAAAAGIGLLVLDGPVTRGTTGVTPHPALAAWLADHPVPARVYGGHRQHLRPVVGDGAIIGPLRTARIEAAGDYSVATAVHYALASHRGYVVDALTISLCGAWLHRRATEGGTAALLDDLRAVATADDSQGDGGAPLLDRTRRTETALVRAAEAVASADPERFVELLLNALRHDGYDAVADEVLRTAWPTPLAVREVVALGAAPDTWAAPVTAAATLDDGRTVVVGPNGAQVVGSGVRAGGLEDCTAVAVAGDLVVVAAGSMVDHFPVHMLTGVRGGPSRARLLPGPVTVLTAADNVAAAGTAHGIIAVVDLRTGAITSELVGHGAEVTALLIAADDLLISGAADGTARSWNPRTREQLAMVPHRGPVRHVAVVKPGVVVTADDAGRLVWWVPRSGKVLRRADGHDGPVTGLLLDGFLGAVVSAGADGRLRHWDGDEPLAVTEPVLRLARVPGGFVTWHGSGELRWWGDVTGRQTGAARPAGIVAPVLGLYPDGNDVVVLVHAGGAVTVRRDAASAPYLGLLAVNPDGVVTAGRADGLVRTTGRPLPVLSLPAAPVSVVANAGGGWAVADADGGLTWLSDAGTAVDPRRATLLAEDTAGHVAAYDGDGVVLMPNPPQQNDDDLVIPATGVSALAVGGPDTVVVGDRAGRIRHVRRNGTFTREVGVEVGAAVTALAVSGRWVVAGTADGRVLRWDPGEPPTELGRHDGPVTGLAPIVEPPLVWYHAGSARAGDRAATAADTFSAALRAAGLDVPDTLEAIAPRRRWLQSCKDGAEASDAVIVVLAGSLGDGLGRLEVEAAVRAAAPHQPVIPVLVTSGVPLPPFLHDRQAVSISDVEAVVAVLRGRGSGPVVSASADGTVRVWDVRLGAEWARYAAPGPVHAVVAVPGTREVVARTGPDELTYLTVATRGSAVSPLVGDRSGPPEPGGFAVRLRARAVCELRAVELSVAGTDVPLAALRLTGLDPRFPIALRPDGRLARPRRMHPDDGPGVEVRADVGARALLFVTVAVPDRPDELTFPLPLEDPA